MNCTNCGAEIAPGTRFCVRCGQPVAAEPAAVQQPVQYYEQPAQTATATASAPKLDVNEIKSQLSSTIGSVAQKLKPVFSNKKVLMGIGGVLAVILIIGIIVAIVNSGNGFIQTKQYTMAVHNGDEISIVVDNKVLSDTISSDSNPMDTVSSLDGKVTAILTYEGELYVVNGKKVVSVDEDVTSFQLSASGKGLAYAVDDDDEYTLKLYTVSSKKTVTVSDELYSLNFAISPDGKSVVYTVDDDDETEVMYFSGKSSKQIASDMECILGLSNGGKYIYMVSENDDYETILYSYNAKGERENLGDISSESVRFNKDHTQVMFYNDSKTYISNKGKDAEKVASDTLYLVLAPNSRSTSCGSDYTYATTYPVSSLYDHVYYGDDAWLIKKNASKSVKLVSNVSMCSLDESAEYLYYIHNSDELQVLQISKGSKAYAKAKTLADDVSNYVVTSNRKLVYFISDETLYSVNGKKGGTARKITNDDVESYYLAINSKNVVYYIMDGDAYACNNGKKGTKIVSDALYTYSTSTGTAYVMNEDSLYATKTAKKMKQILSIDD